jgi:prepilin-type processing-associated H-X9-DG protein
MQQALPAFRCPSDTAPPLNTDQRVPNGGAGDVNCTTGCVEIATANYIVSNHSWDLERETPNGLFGKSTGGGAPHIAKPIGDVFDGTSNTFILGERTWILNNVKLQAAVALAANGDSEANSNQGLVYAMGCGRYPMNCIATNCDRGFSGIHPGGAMFAMVDGSVRFVSENIDHNTTNATVDSVYERLIAIADGQPIGDF